MDTRHPDEFAFKVAARLDQRLMAPDADRMLRYFRFKHLPPQLQSVSAEFATVALGLELRLRSSAERTVALRKLLESKDAAVRAALDEMEAAS